MRMCDAFLVSGLCRGASKTEKTVWPHPNIEGDVMGMMGSKMSRSIGIAFLLAGCLALGSAALAQADGSGQGKTSAGQKKPAAAQSPASAPADANPFPTDTSNVPLMPTSITPDLPSGSSSDSAIDHMAAPFADLDPVKSPDEGDASVSTGEMESSSDLKSMDSLLPAPGEDEPSGKHGKKDNALEGPPRETSKEDISVGQYYLDNKDWKAALSRFQSALVLAPDEPEVYWGLAEANRHLGNFAVARANYLKVIEYDPDSRRAKDAKKALREPEMANAKSSNPTQSSTGTSH